MSTSKTDEFYDKLKFQLYDTALWPSDYLYKFIIKSDSEKIAKLEAVFNNLDPLIHTKESKNGKYTSISVTVLLKNPELVIEKYKEVAEKIEGVISL